MIAFKHRDSMMPIRLFLLKKIRMSINALTTGPHGKNTHRRGIEKSHARKAFSENAGSTQTTSESQSVYGHAISNEVCKATRPLGVFQQHYLILYLSLIFLISFFISSCQNLQEKPATQKKIRVITTLFPLYDFCRIIGQEKVEVILLLPPGVEAHAYEPKPADIVRIHDSDLLVFTGSAMEPWVPKILKGIQSTKLSVIDSSKGISFPKMEPQFEDKTSGHSYHKHDGMDPHIWLDFDNAGKMIDAITEGLIAKDGRNKDFYLKNARDYHEKLVALDKKYQASLAGCKNKFIVYAGHASVGYLMNRYHIRYISAYKGFSPDSEPTPKALAEMVNIVKKNGLRYIYYEELITPKVADVISRETGVGLLMLHGAHNVTKKELDSGVSYIILMERNLENLIKGMECRQISSP